MSDTPKTDAEVLRILNDDSIFLNAEIDRMADFARQLERELAASQAGRAKWQALAEGLAVALKDCKNRAMDKSIETHADDNAKGCVDDIWEWSEAALAAYEAAKAGGAAAEPAGLAVDSVALARALLETRDIQVYGDGCSTQERDTWILAKMIDTALAAKANNLPDPLAEAVKRCDWKEDEDGNWYTACHQFMCFEHAPPNEQGYTFCHRCGHPISFVEFAPRLD